MDKTRAEEILKDCGALLNGHFILTSGKHSDRYMQCAQILCHPNYTAELIEDLAAEFKDDGVEIVIGPATGGIIIAYEMARQLKCINIFAERQDGNMTLRRGFTIPEGTRVLVVEDVITTGGTVHEVIDIVKSSGGVVAGVAVLVQRGKADFGVKTRAAYTTEITAYDPTECPMCKAGSEAVKPGSRGLK